LLTEKNLWPQNDRCLPEYDLDDKNLISRPIDVCRLQINGEYPQRGNYGFLAEAQAH
jgi:hypothetical protein